ncbi:MULTISPECIES: hypothetical protein [Amycolatopsis]|uniref:Uncharacterized protein n=1 Tax=Amycolatopsis albidoflavus TaxID=102226 RepID=A0ABW5I9A9_9PSEU
MSEFARPSRASSRYSGLVEVRFQRFYISEAPEDRTLGSTAAEDGLISAGRGRIRCRTGLGNQLVDVVVDVSRTVPDAVLPDFSEVVEISYRSEGGALAILSHDDRLVAELPALPAGAGEYRLRYHLRDLECTRGACLLQVWPAAFLPSKTVKVTSDTGRFWSPLPGLPRQR